MKTEWLFADVTPAGSPDRAERAILGMILGVFWSIQAFIAYVVVELVCSCCTSSYFDQTKSRPRKYTSSYKC